MNRKEVSDLYKALFKRWDAGEIKFSEFMRERDKIQDEEAKLGPDTRIQFDNKEQIRRYVYQRIKFYDSTIRLRDIKFTAFEATPPMLLAEGNDLAECWVTVRGAEKIEIKEHEIKINVRKYRGTGQGKEHYRTEEIRL